MPAPSYEEKYAYVEKRIDALKTNKTGDERQTEGEVFDRKKSTAVDPSMASAMCFVKHLTTSPSLKVKCYRSMIRCQTAPKTR